MNIDVAVVEDFLRRAVEPMERLHSKLHDSLSDHIRADLQQVLSAIHGLQESARHVQYEHEEHDVERRNRVKARARVLDPECWASYSGMSREHKRFMEARRVKSLATAEHELKV
jgi:hypothetical protein